jgi:hypothetical protein
MSRCAFLAAALIVLLPGGPCFAVDAKQKMATCGDEGKAVRRGVAPTALLFDACALVFFHMDITFGEPSLGIWNGL